MTDRALITVIDDRQQRHFYQDHGPPQLLIPRLAGFVGWADAHAVPLTLPAYQAYSATWLGTPHGTNAGLVGLAGLDHRYRLRLSEPDSGFDLTVHDRIRRPSGEKWLLAEHLSSRADLHTAAARMCGLMARVGGPAAADWRDRAEEFHRLRRQAAGAATTTEEGLPR
jgi:hypothetical protein